MGRGYPPGRTAMRGIEVTTIVPTFRRPAQLLEAVRSALSQERVAMEVRVIDDSPEGSAREAIESLEDPRVTYSKRPTPSFGRPAIVRNEAWPLARGRFVHFLDDDDILVPGAYRAHLDALNADPAVGMSFGRIEPFGEDPDAIARERAFWQGGATRARRAARLGRFALVATMLFDDAIFQNSACMVRKSVLEETGGFDPLMPLQEDTEMHARGTRRRGSLFVDRTVIRYRVNPKSLMRAGDVQSMLSESYARMHRKYRDEYGRAEFIAMKAFIRSRRVLQRIINA
jgi:glycosyltransferase involved in cell wall biosynthesis